MVEGGEWAKRFRAEPWVDWANYWAAGDASSRASEYAQGAIAKAIKEKIIDEGQGHINPNGRGVDGAMLDLEYECIELIKFNLFDNYTYDEFVTGRDGVPGPSLKTWDEMRLPAAPISGLRRSLQMPSVVRWRISWPLQSCSPSPPTEPYSGWLWGRRISSQVFSDGPGTPSRPSTYSS